MHYFSPLFGKELSTSRTDLLSLNRSLDTVYMQYVFVILVMLTVSKRDQDVAC